MKIVLRIVAALAVLAALFSAAVGAADAPAGRYKVVFQVSDNDPAKWNLALNNIRNIQQDLGRENVEIELVAYGPGLNMLKLESPAAARIAEALASGAGIVACENTMTNTKTSKADILPNVGYVKAGVVELVEKQRQGWAYIRP
jgi:intracellular sulfur oxidation DsrE/DsrF family protein